MPQPEHLCHLPIASEYSELGVNPTVPLYAGPLTLVTQRKPGEGEGTIERDPLQGAGTIEFGFSPSARIRFTLETQNLWACADEDVSLVVPGGAEPVAVIVDGTHWSSCGPGSMSGIFEKELGFPERKEDGCAEAVGCVQFHLVNHRSYHGEAIHTTASGQHRSWPGRTSFTFAKWHVTLDSLPEGRERFDQAKRLGGYAFTHTGIMRRQDNKLFTPTQAERPLEFLYWLFAFTNGARCGCVLPVGLRHLGRPLWKKWGAHNIALAKSNPTWFSDPAPQQCFQVADGCFKVWNQEESREWFTLALGLYLESNCHSGRIEIALVTAQIGLELLAWVVLIEQRALITAESFGKLPAADKIRLLLFWMQVPPAIPKQLCHLHHLHASRSAADGPRDGPRVVTDIRNSLVHPTREKRKQMQTGSTCRECYDAWQLSMWYFELILLKLFGYNGGYNNRLGRERPGMIHDHLPWNASGSA